MSVHRMGFEPMKVKPSDLESDPFDRSGIDVFFSVVLLLLIHILYCGADEAANGYSTVSWTQIFF